MTFLSVYYNMYLKMMDANLLRAATHSGKTKCYLLGKGVMEKTLYDVICVIEEHNDIFAVFDRSTELFSSGGTYFQIVEQQMESALNKVTLQQLIGKRKPLQKAGLHNKKHTPIVQQNNFLEG